MIEKNYGIIGRSLSHSLSPFLHNYWFTKYGVKAKYSLIEIEPEELLKRNASLENEVKDLQRQLRELKSAIPTGLSKLAEKVWTAATGEDTGEETGEEIIKLSEEEENEDKIVAEVSEDTIQKEYIFCIDSNCLNDIHGLFDDGSSPIFMEDGNMMCSREEVGKAFYSFIATDEELKEWMEMRDTLRGVAGYNIVGVVVSTLNMFPKMKIFPKMKQ